MNAKHIMMIAGLVVLIAVLVFPWISDDDETPVVVPVTQAPDTQTPETIAPPQTAPIPETPLQELVVSEPSVELIEDQNIPAEEIDTPFGEVVADESITDSSAQEEEPEAEIVIPELNNSDDFVYAELAELNTKNRLLQLLASGQMIRKFVMLVDNVSRGDMPARDLPVLGPRTELVTSELGEMNYLMEPESYGRFDELVSTITTVDTESALALYRLLQPLLNDAYAELGYPNKQFEDVLRKAMELVINTKVPDGPYELTQPSVHYEFANPRVESLSGVEKLLIRMGPQNTQKLQTKLEELAQGL